MQPMTDQNASGLNPLDALLQRVGLYIPADSSPPGAAGDLVYRLAWLIRLGWVGAAGLLVIGLIPTLLGYGSERSLFLQHFGAVAVFAVGYNALLHFLFVYYLRRYRVDQLQPRLLQLAIAVHITLDVGAMAMGIAVTGGIESPALFLMPIVIIASGITLPGRNAYLYALLATFLVALVGVLHLTLPGTWDPFYQTDFYGARALHATAPAVFGYIAAAGGIYLLVAFMTTEVTSRLRRASLTSHRLQTLLAIARSLNSVRGQREVMQALTENVAHAVGAELSGIYLRDETRPGVRLQYTWGSGAERIAGTYFAPGDGIPGRVFAEGQAFVANDLESDMRVQSRDPSAPRLRSTLVVPLMVQGRPAGVIGLANKPGGFNQDDHDLLRAVADQAVVVLENARLFGEVERNAAENNALNDLARAIARTLDVQDVANLVTRYARETTRSHLSVLALIRADRHGLDALSENGQAQISPGELAFMQRWTPAVGITGRVVRTGQIARVDDVSQDPDFDPLPGQAASCLIAPIRRDDEVVGVIILESDRQANYSASDERFIERLAEHAALALNNARLYAEAERRAAELVALHDVSRAIAGSLDLGATLTSVLQAVQWVVPYDMAEICLLTPDGAQLRQAAYLGAAGFSLQGRQSYSTDGGYTGWLVHHAEPLFVPDVDARADVQPVRRESSGAMINAYLGVPLMHGEQLLGTFEMASERRGSFTPEHLSLVSRIAPQAAVAIENARLYAEAQSRLQTIREVATQVIAMAQTLLYSSEMLSHSSEAMSSGAQEIASAIQEIARGAQLQASEVEATSKAIGAMADSTQQIARNSGEVRGASEQVRATVNHTQSALELLGDKAAQIGEIVTVVERIADQTNLLALNAAIEAARAGEHGRGFAVVADEVGKLAEHSRQAVQQIARLSREIGREMNRLVQAAGEMRLAVEHSNALSEATHGLTRAQEQQSDEVVRAVNAVASIAEENAASTEEVAASVEQLTASLEQIASSSQDLSDLANRLDELVHAFRPEAPKPEPAPVAEGV
jgi:GAF domain-containing protein